MIRPDASQLDRLLAGGIEKLCVGGGDTQRRHGAVIFPGSFNPLHEGHRRMAAAAARLTGGGVELEISICNVDKPQLERPAILARLAQFSAEDRVWLTRVATFAQKSRLFAGATFVVGMDTVLRLADPRYHGHCERRCAATIAEIADRNCKFLVFGRVMDGKFRTLSDVALPRSLLALCREVAESEFREDVSSTMLRRQSKE